MNVTSRVVFWTTASVTGGLGHVRRCLSLAEALRAHGTAPAFLLDAGEPVVKYVQQHGFEATVNPDSATSAMRFVREAGGTTVIVDSYTITSADLRRLHTQSSVVAIDDLADRELPVDVVINASPAKTPADYRALPSTQYLLGPAYALLRREFEEQLPPDRIRERVERILITVGGSDPNRIAPQLVRWCSMVLPRTELHVIAGPLFDDTLEKEIRSVSPAVTCHRNPSDVRGLMLRCDLALCGGGQTIYEIAATGTPCVAVGTAPNQTVNLNAFERLGMLELAGKVGDEQLRDRTLAAIELLAGDPARRSKMSERGRSIVDGAGATRVAAALVETFDAANQNR